MTTDLELKWNAEDSFQDIKSEYRMERGKAQVNQHNIFIIPFENA